MFGSCRLCYRPTDKWLDFCNDCATEEYGPRFRVIEGGKSGDERSSRDRDGLKQWLRPVPPSPPSA